MRHINGIAIATSAVALTTAVTTAIGPVFLFNGSPSLPEGWYIRTWESPSVGKIIAFGTPMAGRGYIEASPSMAFYKNHPLLKPIAAEEGSTLCRQGDVFLIDGIAMGNALERDSAGIPLPRWSGCRVLKASEFGVFSSRISSSFDSRYYAQVPASAVLGVFRKL